jgi:hypothetical protein
MKVNEAHFGISVEVSPSYWVRGGFKAEVEEGEDPLKVIEQLKELVFAAIPTAPEPTAYNTKVQMSSPDTADMIIEQINKCVAFEGVNQLKTYRIVAPSDARIQEAYNRRLRELEKITP